MGSEFIEMKDIDGKTIKIYFHFDTSGKEYYDTMQIDVDGKVYFFDKKETRNFFWEMKHKLVNVFNRSMGGKCM